MEKMFEYLRKLDTGKLNFIFIIIWIVTIYGSLTYIRNKTWKNPITLWTDAVLESPMKARPYNNLAQAYMTMPAPNSFIESYNFDIAKLYLKMAINLNPKYSDAHTNMGIIKYKEGIDIEGAMRHFEIAVNYEPDNETALFNLGTAYYFQGQFNKSKDIFNRLRAKNPNSKNLNDFLKTLKYLNMEVK